MINENLGRDLSIQRIYKRVSQEKMSLLDTITISDYFDVSMGNLFNKKDVGL